MCGRRSFLHWYGLLLALPPTYPECQTQLLYVLGGDDIAMFASDGQPLDSELFNRSFSVMAQLKEELVSAPVYITFPAS